MTRRGLVIGGGGTLGLAWSVGALAAVEEALDWDARTAAVIVGSGSGAEIAATLGASYTTESMVRAISGHPGAPRLLAEQFGAERRVLPNVPFPAPSSLGLTVAGLRRKVPAQGAVAGLLPVGTGSYDRIVDFGRALARLSTGSPNGWVSHPATWIIAAERKNGTRVPFGFRTAPPTDLGTALAAANARPGWFPPVRIGDRGYVEASVASPTSADLLLPLALDEIVVIAPTSSADAGLGSGVAVVERVLRRGTTMRVDLEEGALRSDGTRVLRIEPGEEDLSVIGLNPMDFRRRTDVLMTSLRTSKPRVQGALLRSQIETVEPTLDAPRRRETAAVGQQQRKALTAPPAPVESVYAETHLGADLDDIFGPGPQTLPDPEPRSDAELDVVRKGPSLFRPPSPTQFIPPVLTPRPWRRLLRRWFGASRPTD